MSDTQSYIDFVKDIIATQWLGLQYSGNEMVMLERHPQEGHVHTLVIPWGDNTRISRSDFADKIATLKSSLDEGYKIGVRKRQGIIIHNEAGIDLDDLRAVHQKLFNSSDVDTQEMPAVTGARPVGNQMVNGGVLHNAIENLLRAAMHDVPTVTISEEGAIDVVYDAGSNHGSNVVNALNAKFTPEYTCSLSLNGGAVTFSIDKNQQPQLTNEKLNSLKDRIEQSIAAIPVRVPEFSLYRSGGEYGQLLIEPAPVTGEYPRIFGNVARLLPHGYELEIDNLVKGEPVTAQIFPKEGETVSASAINTHLQYSGFSAGDSSASTGAYNSEGRDASGIQKEGPGTLGPF